MLVLVGLMSTSGSAGSTRSVCETGGGGGEGACLKVAVFKLFGNSLASHVDASRIGFEMRGRAVDPLLSGGRAGG